MNIPRRPIAGLRILVVEDEALIAEEICSRLNLAGCDVVGTADSGKGAVESAMTLFPDLILMDIRLKGEMDGIEAAELIHKAYRVPIVYLTAHSDEGTLRRAKSSPIAGFVLKPFHIRNLLVAIEVAIHRFEMERQLESSQLTYAAVLGSVSDGVVAADTDGAVVFMNSMAETLTGWSISEAHGRPWSEVVRFADSGGAVGKERFVERVLASQVPVELDSDEHVLNRQGERTPIDGVIAPIVDGLGCLLGATITLRDTSEMRRAYADLEAIARQFRAVVDTAVDGVVLVDRDGAIRMFNPAMVRLFGYAPEAMDKLMIGALVDWSPRVSGGLLQTELPERSTSPLLVKSYPTRGRRISGATFPVELSIGESHHAGQSVYVCVVHDQTDRQAMQAELLAAIGCEQRRLADDLHNRLGQELDGLALLIEAIARAARSSQIPDPTDMERLQDIVRHAVRSCRSISRGLAPVSESQGGLLSGLRELVAGLSAVTGPRIDLQTIEHSKLGLTPVVTDHLYHIAQEALANALSSANASTITVTLDVEPDNVRLEVTDNGSGTGASPARTAKGSELRAMKYRASAIGARLQIKPLGPSGTCVICECPQAA